MNQSKKRLFTGLQPSGTLHIGNYFGALKQFKECYEEFESMLMVADYHALTSLKERDCLHQNIISVVKDYLAVGVDPKVAIIFQQSQVPEHTELAWVLESLVSVSFLMQAHAYKDKVAKGLDANAGLFNYPMLMAADILLYDADLVPVGKDQRQHIEYTREAASKFNNAFKEIFTPPKELILERTDTVPGTDGQKMSKSYGNTIPLFGTKEEITKAVMSIVTDSSGDFPKNVHSLHKLFKPEAELKDFYKENAGNYKILKEALVEDIETLVAPMRDVRASVSDKAVSAILKEGSERAREKASAKMELVRDIVGVSFKNK